MSCKTVFIVYVLALIQAISARFIDAYNGLAGTDLLSLRASCDPFASALLSEAWTTPYDIGPYDDSTWAAPYGFGPFTEAWGTNRFSLDAATLAASNGIKFAVTSYSPITPFGVSIFSENVYEGPLAITGAVPFLGAVTLEGALPTIGGGAVNYGCGDGDVSIISEDLAEFNVYDGPFIGDLYGYDDLVGPYGYGYNGIIGPNCGRFGPYGYNGLYY
ncbi:unnamed protein product [Euphydryas editha]|uniref:Uncharacterized protein n=1 Tax=Euphydryas editha TaxID=104508 RepID=A0AAU9TAC2_EUPED|nr:unnamed protein product [Euphydryas editha]